MSEKAPKEAMTLIPKRQFVLFAGLQILAMVMMLIGYLASSKIGIHSLIYLGLAFGMQAQLFSVRAPKVSRSWLARVATSLAFFVIVGLMIVLDVADTKRGSSNLDLRYIYLLCVIVFPITCLWEIFKEYRAVQKILNVPPET